jgi:hypothetical protein
LTTLVPPPLLRYTVGRFSANELVLFDEEKRESWIVYPPRSAYDFLKLRRPSPGTTVVEHHPWAPFSEPEDHLLRPADACTSHGTACQANEVVQAAAQMGFDPFG